MPEMTYAEATLLQAMNRRITELETEVERLAKCCTQRGARMQIMRDWMAARRLWQAFWPKYDAQHWFDEDGVPK